MLSILRGRPYARHRCGRFRRLILEPLEGRALLSLASVVEPGGLLRIRADADDPVVIGSVNGFVTINGADPDSGPSSSAMLTTIDASGTANGGPDANTFDFRAVVPASFPALTRISIDGGRGRDQLIGPDQPTTWVVTSSDAGLLIGPTPMFDFASVEDLVGGRDDDTFVIVDGAGLTGSIDGGSGLDTLDFGDVSGGVVVVLAESDSDGFRGSATGLDSGFAHVERLIGGSGSDTLTGEDVASTWTLASESLYDDGSHSLGLSNFESLHGGSGADTFDLVGDDLSSVTADLDGGGGEDHFRFNGAAVLTGQIVGGDGLDTLDYGSFGSTVSVLLTGSNPSGYSGTEALSFSGGFAGIDALIGSPSDRGDDDLAGADEPAAWSLDRVGSYRIGHGVALAIAGFESLRGGAATDHFEVAADASSGTPHLLAGGPPDSAPGDILSFDARGGPVTQTPGSLTAPGFGTLTYTGIESVEILNPAAPIPVADLVISQVHTPDPATTGLDLTLTLTVRNLGPSAATKVVVANHLPVGATVIAPGSFRVVDGVLTSNLGTIASGASVSVVLVLRFSQPGRFVNLAQVQSQETDPRPASNATSAILNVHAPSPPPTEPVTPGEPPTPPPPPPDNSTPSSPPYQDVTPPIVVALVRLGYHRQPTRLVVSFSEPMDPAQAVDLHNVRLVSPGPDGRFGTRDDRRVRLIAARYDPDGGAVVLRPVRRLPRWIRFQLTINRPGIAGMADAAGNLLDGDRDGRPGGTFAARFGREPAPRFLNHSDVLMTADQGGLRTKKSHPSLILRPPSPALPFRRAQHRGTDQDARF